MFAAFVTSFKFDPLELATRRILPLVWPWPFFSLGLVDFGSESSWTFLGGIVGGARRGEEGEEGGSAVRYRLICLEEQRTRR